MASVNLMGTYLTGICIEHQLLIFWFTRRGVTWRQGQLLKHDRVGAGAQVGGKSVRCGDDVVVPSRTCWPVGHSSAQTLIELTGDSVG